MLEKFEAAVKRHGENLIFEVLENWERHNSIRSARPMTMEERWERFIRETDSFACAAV